MILLITEKLPKYVKSGMYDIQGAHADAQRGAWRRDPKRHLAAVFESAVAGKKIELVMATCVFRLGDKVMQIKNNYQRMGDSQQSMGLWWTADRAYLTGIFGIIKRDS